MDYKNALRWLENYGLALNESCPAALNRLAKVYKKENGITLLDDVYRSIGTSKQEISWWNNHLCNTQTKKTQVAYSFFSCRLVFAK